MHYRNAQIQAATRIPFKAVALAIAIAVALPTNVAAQDAVRAQEEVFDFDIPAGDLSTALDRFSTQSGVQAMYMQELVANKRAAAVLGSYRPSEALERILEGTGLTLERVNNRTFVIKAGRVQSPAQPPSLIRNTSERPGDTGKATEFDDVVVVGSRLGSSPVQSAMPVKVITRDDIDRSGAGSISQILSYLSEVPINNNEDRALAGLSALTEGANTNSTTIQMRGMPRGTTLVLINGRRAGDSPGFSSSGFFDLSTFPLAMVERIEVLPAGSSAVYGGDALAGVINVVLRKDASGLELRWRRDAADGYGGSQFSAMWGRSWSRGAMTVSGNWSKQSALYNHERSITADMDFQRFGGRDRRSAWGYPATVYSLGGCPVAPRCNVPLDRRDPLPGLDSPTAVVPVDSNGVGLKPEDFRSTQGRISKETPRRHLISPEEKYGIHVNGNFELRSNVEAFGELTYTRRDIPAWQAQFIVSGGDAGLASGSLAADHPFNPFGVPVGVNFFYKDTGIFVSYGQDHYRGVLGLRGEAGRVDWEVSGWQSRDTSRASGASFFNQTLVAAALASKDPAKTLNPFVSDGGPPASPEVLRSLLQMPLLANMGTRTTGLTAFARSVVAQLPAGDVIGLLGGERQTYRLDIDSNSTSLIAPQVHGSTTSEATFGEIRVPIVAAADGQAWERVALTGALRRETSERFTGAALTKTFGVELKPWDSLLLRGTYSTGFRPLVLYSMVQDPRESRTSAYDPQFGGQLVSFDQRNNGGAPDDLRPESSRTTTMGLVYQPSNSWMFSATHWNLEFFDQISNLSSQTLINNEQMYPGRVTRNPTTGVIEYVDARQVNISLRETAGVDLALEGNWKTRIGDIYPSLSATYTYRFDQQLSDSSAVVANVAVYDAAGWAPRWKIVPRVGWDYEFARAMLVGRYVSKYRDSMTYSTGPDAGKYPILGDFWTFDLNVDLSLEGILPGKSSMRGVNVMIGANNLFNRAPDFCAGCLYTGYDASQYDIIGRKVYLEIRKNL